MSPELSLTLGGAFVTGLVTSIHCVGMCGPLACLACQRSPACKASNAAAHYQSGRLLAYGAVGALAGALGGTLASWLPPNTVRVLFWIVGISVLVLALSWTFGWKLALPAAWKPRLQSRITPGLLGLATPLIPCGPLYLVFAVCALTASPVRGAALAVTFGLGTLPLLWLAQHQWWRVQQWLGNRRALLWQRGVILVTAIIVLWRLQAGDGFLAPDCCPLPAALIP